MAAQAASDHEKTKLPRLGPEKDARRFILEHPTDIDLRKVDQFWFLDVITNGLVRAPEVHNSY